MPTQTEDEPNGTTKNALPILHCLANGSCKHERANAVHMISCARCEVWYHSDCLNISRKTPVLGVWVCEGCEGFLPIMESEIEKLAKAYTTLQTSHLCLQKEHEALHSRYVLLNQRCMLMETQVPSILCITDRLAALELQVMESINHGEVHHLNPQPINERTQPETDSILDQGIDATAQVIQASQVTQNSNPQLDLTGEDLEVDRQDVQTPPPSQQDTVLHPEIPSESIRESYAGILQRNARMVPTPSTRLAVTAPTLRAAPRKQTPPRKQEQHPSRYFVTRLAPDTKPQEIIGHLELKLGVTPKCTQLRTRHPTYASFCIEIDTLHAEGILQCGLWPEGTIMKRYEGRPPATRALHRPESSLSRRSKNLLNWGHNEVSPR